MKIKRTVWLREVEDLRGPDRKYIVERAENTTEFRIGQVLEKDEVDEVINAGVLVKIVRKA